MTTKELSADAMPRMATFDRDAALDDLARRCGPRACSVARGFVGSSAQAEELVQEALANAYERLEQLREPSALDSWFYRSVVRLSLNATRKRSRWYRFAVRWRETQDEFQPPPCTDADRLRAAVAELPEKQRVAVVLRHGNDFALKEVADAMNISPESAKTHISRGMKRLRMKLGVNND